MKQNRSGLAPSVAAQPWQWRNIFLAIPVWSGAGYFASKKHGRGQPPVCRGTLSFKGAMPSTSTMTGGRGKSVQTRGTLVDEHGHIVKTRFISAKLLLCGHVAQFSSKPGEKRAWVVAMTSWQYIDLWAGVPPKKIQKGYN